MDLATLSGSDWVMRFPTSASVDDLCSLFQLKVKAFLAALTQAGASVSIAATFRPPERAFLMHYSFQVAKGLLHPTQVPAMASIDIDWVHRTASGDVDLAASQTAAGLMVQGYDIVFAPALSSRHTEGNAIDMDICWNGNLTIAKADGTSTTITTLPRNGSNPALVAVGATYGVIKLATDPPHWSSDGH